MILEGNPADSTLAVDMIARQQEIYGRVPRQAAYDGGFASKDNLKAYAWSSVVTANLLLMARRALA